MEFSVSEMIERIKTLTPLKNLETIGILKGTISAWKTNNRPPRSDDLYKIAQYLNVSMEWLLTGKDTDLESVYKSKYQNLLNSLQNLISNS